MVAITVIYLYFIPKTAAAANISPITEPSLSTYHDTAMNVIRNVVTNILALNSFSDFHAHSMPVPRHTITSTQNTMPVGLNIANSISSGTMKPCPKRKICSTPCAYSDRKKQVAPVIMPNIHGSIAYAEFRSSSYPSGMQLHTFSKNS